MPFFFCLTLLSVVVQTALWWSIMLIGLWFRFRPQKTILGHTWITVSVWPSWKTIGGAPVNTCLRLIQSKIHVAQCLYSYQPQTEITVILYFYYSDLSHSFNTLFPGQTCIGGWLLSHRLKQPSGRRRFMRTGVSFPFITSHNAVALSFNGISPKNKIRWDKINFIVSKEIFIGYIQITY